MVCSDHYKNKVLSSLTPILDQQKNGPKEYFDISDQTIHIVIGIGGKNPVSLT